MKKKENKGKNKKYEISQEQKKEVRKKQKTLAWLAIIITAVNFLLAIIFFVYLYFWIKSNSI